MMVIMDASMPLEGGWVAKDDSTETARKQQLPPVDL
jgi:hypothetical protein